jgi:hypothetical protein
LRPPHEQQDDDPTDTTRFLDQGLKEFETFPEPASSICLAALTIAAEGGKADIAKRCAAWGLECSRSPCRFGEMRSRRLAEML